MSIQGMTFMLLRGLVSGWWRVRVMLVTPPFFCLFDIHM